MTYLETVCEFVADIACIRELDVNYDSQLLELGVDSLDLVELVMMLEEEYNIEVRDEDSVAFVSVGAVVEYLERQLGKVGDYE